MPCVLVIGATGDVGQGVVAALLQSGQSVLAVARQAPRLQALALALGSPPALRTLTGSVASDAQAAALKARVQALCPALSGVVVSVNAPRELAELLAQSTAQFTARVGADLATHFTAARTFLPLLAPGSTYLGIGGGSADFVLEGAVHLSVAQAGLRMLYRGLAHEAAMLPTQPHVRELVIASVVNGASNRAQAHPAWVTAEEVGALATRLITHPSHYPHPIWRIARRDVSGEPVISPEGPTRIQGLHQPLEPH